MAAQNTPAQNILDAAKQSEQKFTATNFVDVINQMVQNNFVVNNRNMWFRTRGNTVKSGSTDTAVTETVVDVAKTVKNIALSTSDSTATITLSGVSTSLKSVDVIAGILRVMGFYDSDKMTVKEFAEKLYKEIDLMECDRLSQDTIRGIIVNVSGDSKIEVEKKTINYIYKQLIDKGITSKMPTSGGVIDNTVLKGVHFMARGNDYYDSINKPEIYDYANWNKLIESIDDQDLLFMMNKYKTEVDTTNILGGTISNLDQLLESDEWGYYIFLSKLNASEELLGNNLKMNFDIVFFKKNNVPYMAFGYSANYDSDAYRQTYVENDASLLSYGGKFIEQSGTESYYGMPGSLAWTDTDYIIEPMSEKQITDKVELFYNYIPSASYKFSWAGYEADGVINYSGGLYSNNDIENLIVYPESNLLTGSCVMLYNKTEGWHFISNPHIIEGWKESGKHLEITSILGDNMFQVRQSWNNVSKKGGIIHTKALDNLVKNGEIGKFVKQTIKPNFSSRIDTSNDDLVGQLNMSTEDYGRYDATGEIGRNVYAIFNPDAGSSKTLADADKITNGDVTNNQKHNAEDTTSEATNETEDDDSIGDSTGTSTDEGIIPHLKPQYIAKRSMCNLYRVNQTAVRTLTDYLWSTDITNTLRKMYADPMDCILGLYVLPFSPQDVTESVDIYLGNVNLNTKAGLVNSYQEEYVAGVIEVRPYNHDVRDFSPYSEYYLYLPYIGIIELNSEDVVGAKLTIYYDVDLISGSILAKIQVERGNMNVCLYQFAGSCIYRLPISKSEMSNIIDISANSALGIATSVATGSVIPAAISASQTAMHAGLTNKVSQGQMIAGNANIMANTQPYMIIKHKTPQTPTNFNKFYGKPTFKTVTLKNQSGFTKVRDINLSNIPLTSTEIDELENMLKEGVII